MFRTLGAAVILAVGAVMATAQDAATPAKPNILVIFGDDIGQGNISIYTSLCERAREDAFNQMLAHAGQLGQFRQGPGIAGHDAQLA